MPACLTTTRRLRLSTARLVVSLCMTEDRASKKGARSPPASPAQGHQASFQRLGRFCSPISNQPQEPSERTVSQDRVPPLPKHARFSTSSTSIHPRPSPLSPRTDVMVQSSNPIVSIAHGMFKAEREQQLAP